MFPAPIYNKGLAYFRNNQVSDLLYDINNHVWTANVRGTEDHFVEVNLSNYEKGSIHAYCDCAAFDTQGSCKHIVAVLIGVKNKTEEKASMLDYRVTNHFIDAISSTRQSNTEFIPQQVPMHVEYYLRWSYDRNLYVELKTGEKRCFVVKDLYEFLEDVLEGREHYFTKTFTYTPEVHFFLKQDLDVFDMLYAIIRNEEIYQPQLYFPYQQSKDKRYITIPPLLADSLLEKLSDRDLTVEMNDQSYQHVDIVKDQLPFQFSLTKSKHEELILMMNDVEDGLYLQPYQLLFSHGTFYFPAKEQLPVLEQIAKMGMDNHQLPIRHDQADVFLSEVWPSLTKAGEATISKDVEEEIIQLPLRAKLFLDVKDDLIVGTLEYHYGKAQIAPFGSSPAHDPDVIIIRDVEKEEKIMSLIEYSNFRYNGRELYIHADEEDLYEFLYTILPILDEQVELFLTSEVRGFIVENQPIPNTNVRVETASNLLEVGFDMDGVSDEEINHILQAVIEKKRYYRMHSGALLSLEGEEFTSLKRLFNDLDISKDDLYDGAIKMPVYRGMQVDELIETRKSYDPSFRKLLHRLRSPEEQTYEVPENLDASLRHYQKIGYQWFKSLSAYHLGGILADDMGLGKTLQSIAYILSEPSDQPHLIVAPSSVLYNWKNEFAKFAPDLDVVVLTGAPIEREEMIKQSSHVDVWITSYATLRQDIELYRERTFQTLILDEAQFIKNYATKTSRAMREVKASRRFALSGTPIENSIDELWAIFQVILPGLLPNQKTFRHLPYERIAMITKPFILRRLKEDVLTELPEKIETVHTSELTKDQKELYVGYLRQLQQETAQSIKASGFQKNRMKILAGLTRLRQICCHPSLFMENYLGQSGKLEQLMETIRTSIENGRRMLIFSQFTSMHQIIIENLNKEGIDYFYLHGQTPSLERVEMSERFNQGEKSVFLISLRAGGTGLNLTGADTVILYDLWWNPAVEDQATGRAHRFGQKNVVQVIRMVTEGTIEEKIYELQQKKRELIDQVIQPGETMLSSLTEDDIRDLLSI